MMYRLKIFYDLKLVLLCRKLSCFLLNLLIIIVTFFLFILKLLYFHTFLYYVGLPIKILDEVLSFPLQVDEVSEDVHGRQLRLLTCYNLLITLFDLYRKNLLHYHSTIIIKEQVLDIYLFLFAYA